MKVSGVKCVQLIKAKQSHSVVIMLDRWLFHFHSQQ